MSSPIQYATKMKKALRTLRQEDHLVILPADKGRAKVVLDKESYDSKMLSMLSDTATNETLQQDSVYSLERRLISLLLGLKKRGSISKHLYESLRSTAGHTPYIVQCSINFQNGCFLKWTTSCWHNSSSKF